MHISLIGGIYLIFLFFNYHNNLKQIAIKPTAVKLDKVFGRLDDLKNLCKSPRFADELEATLGLIQWVTHLKRFQYCFAFSMLLNKYKSVNGARILRSSEIERKKFCLIVNLVVRILTKMQDFPLVLKKDAGLTDIPTNLIFLDASLEGEMAICGGVIITPHTVSAFSYAPGWGSLPDFIKMKSHIGVWEALSYYILVTRYKHLLVGAYNIVWGDNVADIYSLIHGFNKCRNKLAIILATIALLTRWDLHMYFSYVQSARNLADATTRAARFKIIKDVTGADTDLVKKIKFQVFKEYVDIFKSLG